MVNSFPEISFVDLKAQQNRIRPALDRAIARVLDHGGYIMGPEVVDLEKALAIRGNIAHVLSCSNGTDALILAMMTKGVGPGDVVFVPSFTFVATAEAVAFLGAIPFFVDVRLDTFNICINSLTQAIASAQAQNLRAVGMIPVDLFGLPADYDALHLLAAQHNLWMIADAAQSFGGAYQGQPVGSLAAMTCTSFFPAKPLGGYGDGGAIFTQSQEEHDFIASCRVHGQGSHKYENVRLGMTGRLDTLQAAILLEKLTIFSDEIVQRNRIADRYTALLKDVVQTPYMPAGMISAWAQYTVRTPHRDALQESLKAAGVPTMVYYPIPLPDQVAYRHYPSVEIPVTKQLCQEVMSLPMHPYLAPDVQDYICAQVRAGCERIGTHIHPR